MLSTLFGPALHQVPLPPSHIDFLNNTFNHHHIYIMSTEGAKRKWDESTPEAKAGTPTAGKPDEATSAAAAIAAKIAASIRGPSGAQGHELMRLIPGEDGHIKDIPINDLKNRYVLTKGSTQKQVRLTFLFKLLKSLLISDIRRDWCFSDGKRCLGTRCESSRTRRGAVVYPHCCQDGCGDGSRCRQSPGAYRPRSGSVDRHANTYCEEQSIGFADAGWCRLTRTSQVAGGQAADRIGQFEELQRSSKDCRTRCTFLSTL